MKRPLGKSALTYAAQVAKLVERGLAVEDPDPAAFYLQHLNYYRLGAYEPYVRLFSDEPEDVE